MKGIKIQITLPQTAIDFLKSLEEKGITKSTAITMALENYKKEVGGSERE